MLKKLIGGWAALIALSGASGCCSFWERHCAQPVCAQTVPACCQPCVPACAPAPIGYQPPPGNWTVPAQRAGYAGDACCPP